MDEGIEPGRKAISRTKSIKAALDLLVIIVIVKSVGTDVSPQNDADLSPNTSAWRGVLQRPHRPYQCRSDNPGVKVGRH